jgi:hypothetical protein
MLLHRDEAGDNLRNLLTAWDVRASKPKVLTWRPVAAEPGPGATARTCSAPASKPQPRADPPARVDS